MKYAILDIDDWDFTMQVHFEETELEPHSEEFSELMENYGTNHNSFFVIPAQVFLSNLREILKKAESEMVPMPEETEGLETQGDGDGEFQQEVREK